MTSRNLGPDVKPSQHTILDRRVGRRRFVVGSTTMLATLAGVAGSRGAMAQGTAEPARGGRAVIALIQEPGQMNPYFNIQSGSFLSTLVVDPLFVPDASGNYLPVLAAEVPTIENGGISEDFLTITYKLRDGITWSDGEPFTADDVVFSHEIYKDPGSTTVLGPAYELIESVEAIDPLTVRVRMTAINPAYLELWNAEGPVQPKHKFESSAVDQEHPLARLPLGTGPFVFTDWKTGDEITLERNPNYRDPGKPRLDAITIKVAPEKESAIASFVAGEFDTVYFIVTGDLPTLTQAEAEGAGIVVQLQEGPSHVEWLWLNLSDGGDPSKPHPVFGDPAIREAMDHGIDRQTVIDEVLGGFGYQVGSFIYSGWAAVDIPAAAYDPQLANQILDDAGWAIGSDGIREKEGVRASLRYQSIAGDQTRELYQQVVQQNLRDIGIELNIENVPSNTIFGSWEEGGIYARGDYDILMSRAGFFVDPAQWANEFTSDQIPTAEFPAGLNRVRYQSPEFDAAIAEGASTLDQEVRAEAYQRAAERFAADRPAIPLYSSAWGWTWNERLEGVSTDFWEGMWPSSADWHVEE
ncbi:MAG: peptide ABC transporter substrate-binding protein [Chloroflexota bacterium]|nr:peptide ABC transporter substrate-binding protein [Chloroflexota bacterium]